MENEGKVVNICPECGNIIYKIEPPELYKRNCLNCDREFVTNIPNKKYCCSRCLHRYRYNKNKDHINQWRIKYRLKKRLEKLQEEPIKAKTYNKKCPVCEKMFVTEKYDRTYCTEKCKRRNQVIKEKKNKLLRLKEKLRKLERELNGTTD